MFWDVKDFNWLRALKKSPNFEVVPLPTEGGGAEEVASGVEDVAKEGVEMGDSGRGETDEDSEDEL